ncbi:MAG: RNA 2',3'-cyclic phosphodiesterase [Pirellulales bacterium]
MQNVRTFTAVEVWPEIRERARVLINRFKETTAKVSWAKPDQMHLTMNFLGDVPMNDIAAVCKAVAEAVEPFKPFDVEMAGVGVFPSYDNPRTIWLGVGDGSEELASLHTALQDRLGNLGFRIEARRFHPHLTLGRVRSVPTGPGQLAGLIKQQADFEAGPMMVSEITVFSSELGREGPTYEALGHGELLGK